MSAGLERELDGERADCACSAVDEHALASLHVGVIEEQLPRGGADDGDHGVELWKTDGTTGGTVLVADRISRVAFSFIT